MEQNILPKKNITCDPHETLSTAIFLTLTITTAISATVGNTLICMAVYKTKTLRTPANHLLVSLSVASLLFVPVLGGYSFSLTIKECDPRAKTLCKWSSKLDWILFYVVMLHLLFISLDRLLAIKLPMRYPVLVTTKRTLITITVLWIIGIVEGFLPNIMREIIGKDARPLLQLITGCLRNNFIPNERDLQPIIPHFLTLMTVSVLLPSGIMLISHAWIFIISFKQYRQIRTLEDAFSQRRVTEMRAAKTVSVIVFSALACFAPVLTVTLISTFEPPSRNLRNGSEAIVKYRLFPILKILYLLAISFNPLIYALKSEPFKVAFKRMLRPCWANCRPKPPGAFTMESLQFKITSPSSKTKRLCRSR